MTEQERDTANRIKDIVDRLPPETLITLEIQLQGMELGLMAAQTLADMDKQKDKQAS